MAAREKEITERYTKKTLAHIKWLSTLPPLQSFGVRRRDILRHRVLLREMIRDGYDSPDLPTVDFLRRAQEDLVLLRKARAIAKRAMH
jgi:hypothetical protein